jgi:hypothetical protein
MSQSDHQQPVDEDSREHQLITAYCINSQLAMPITPAFAGRAWMDQTPERFAYRCLPLLIANQSGWFLLNQQRISVRWSGDRSSESLTVETPDGSNPRLVSSHFGSGVVTFDVPYLFRTPPGYNLLVRGPANLPKDGIFPLEGVVETDWVAATFSINWKVTRPNCEIIFEVGEPLAMIVPQRRGELEGFAPRIVNIEQDHAVDADYRRWELRRLDFIKRLRERDAEAEKKAWEKQYFRGEREDGSTAYDHRTKMQLKRFDDCRAPVD